MSFFRSAPKTKASSKTSGTNDKLTDAQKSKSLERLKRYDTTAAATERPRQQSVPENSKTSEKDHGAQSGASPKKNTKKKSSKRSHSDIGNHKLRVVQQVAVPSGPDVMLINGKKRTKSAGSSAEIHGETSPKQSNSLEKEMTSPNVSHQRKSSWSGSKEHSVATNIPKPTHPMSNLKPSKEVRGLPRPSSVNEIHVSQSSAPPISPNESVKSITKSTQIRPKSGGPTSLKSQTAQTHSPTTMLLSKSRLPIPTATSAGHQQQAYTQSTRSTDSLNLAARTEKAMKARLYLVQKMGPATFIVTGDNLEIKYRVTIGPQSCSCGKPVCIHLLFVMLRVLKVESNSMLLWAKELKNFEVETLLANYDMRVSRRTSFGKKRQLSREVSSKRQLDSSLQSSKGSEFSDVISSTLSDTMESVHLSKSPDPEADAEFSSQYGSEHDDHSTYQGDLAADFNEDDEVVCPICILELVEGEDVVICANCQNELHQHCMEIWALELEGRGEKAQCPVCRSHWCDDAQISHSNFYQKLHQRGDGKDELPTAYRPKLKSDAVRITLSETKIEDADKLISVLNMHLPSSYNGVFGRSWKIRESYLLKLRENVVSFLLPKPHEKIDLTQSPYKDVVGACLSIVTYSCADPVLKVFLAALELLRSLLGCFICPNDQEQVWLRVKLKPAVSVLLTRCTDAQTRVKECSLQLLLDLCLGNNGPFFAATQSGGSSSTIGGMAYIFSMLCEDPSPPLKNMSLWWLGRLVLLDKLIAKFEQHSVLLPSLSVDFNRKSLENSTTESTHGEIYVFKKLFSLSSTSSESSESSDLKFSTPILSGGMVTPTTSNDFLLMAIAYACKATHVQNYKVCRTAKRITIKAVKYLSTNQDVFDQVVDSVSKCLGSVRKQWLRKVAKMMLDGNSTLKPSSALRGILDEVTDERGQMTSTPNFKSGQLKREAQKGIRVSTSDFDCCDESASDIELKRSSKSFLHISLDGVGNESSPLPTLNGDVSDQKLKQESISTSSQLPVEPSTNLPTKKNEETVKAVKDDSQDALDLVFGCCKSVEREEDEALKKLIDELPPEYPLPPLSGIEPPGPEAVIYMQPGSLVDQMDGDSTKISEYAEGTHWSKGRVIGTGAYCTCFLARDMKSGTIMAVKQVSYCRNTKEEEEKELKRLREEVAMLGRLQHPNIVRCLGATQVEGHFNIFVEWMAGGSLDRTLSDFGAFDEAVIVKYLKQIILGVAYLHENRVIHRDLKGANVLLDSTGQRVRLADFGAAARLAAQVTGAGEFRNDMQGTVAFMAPEVVRGDHYGRRCDIWSIGCVIIQMATGQPPWGFYDVTNSFALIYKIATTKEPPPVPEFPKMPALRDLALRCLEVEPGDRPQAKELLKHSLWQTL